MADIAPYMHVRFHLLGAIGLSARVASCSSALHHPFFGMFTYGELSRTGAGANRYVNLMYSVLAFGD